MLLERTTLPVCHVADVLSLEMHPSIHPSMGLVQVRASKLAVPEGLAGRGVQLVGCYTRLHSPEFVLCCLVVKLQV